MPLFSVPLLGILILNQAMSIAFCGNVANFSESRPSQFALPTSSNTPQQEQRKANEETQHKQHIVNTETDYTNYRSKRDSSETDNDPSPSKRLREFVGKRSDYDVYPVIPEEQYFTPIGISNIAQYPLETYIPLKDSQLFDFDVDRIDTSDGDLQEQVMIPHEEKRLREFVGKRSIDMGTVQWNPFDKRLRDFVGKRDNGDFLTEKRLRDFVGKRVSDLVTKSIDSIENEKRLREFVGKRNDLDGMTLTFPEKFMDISGKISNIDKRPREFLGKRDGFQRHNDIDKSFGDFVGNHSPYLTWTPYQNIEKRLRDFVGKRDQSETFSEDKRLREFVGKRDETDLHNEDKRIREFIGKREDKRPSDSLGQQSMFSDDEEDNTELDKKLRDFVGKRSADGEFEEVKRLRDFVGKRSEFIKDPMELLSAVKRLRDFVGKRNYFPDLHSRPIGKRIREFIGRR